MSVIEKIYEAYIAGELEIKPDRPDSEFTRKLPNWKSSSE